MLIPRTPIFLASVWKTATKTATTNIALHAKPLSGKREESIGRFREFGRDGHIGFNEPTSSLASRIRLKTLKRETIEDNRGLFGADEEPPECAITMGIATILEARKIILLAAGRRKAWAVAQAVEGPLTSSVTASALQLHPEVTLIMDEEASSALVQKDYYRQVLEMTARVTPGRLR